MPDQLVGKQNPFFLRDHLHQILFDFLRIGVARKIEPVGEPGHVRIHDYAHGDAKRRAQHDVRRFSRHARQRQQFLHRARHFAAKFLDDFFARAHDGFGLIPEKARWPDVLFEFRGICVGKIFRRAIFHEQRFRDLIDALVRALRRKNRGDQQLKGIFMDRARKSRPDTLHPVSAESRARASDPFPQRFGMRALAAERFAFSRRKAISLLLRTLQAFCL